MLIALIAVVYLDIPSVPKSWVFRYSGCSEIMGVHKIRELNNLGVEKFRVLKNSGCQKVLSVDKF